jgi:acyl-coenzyme A synthetase/AMP-(fatty) acid ligase
MRLEFLGRLDDQVKIRGFRVEAGEVEAALLRLDVLSDAAVAAHPDPSGMQRLVAYGVLRPGASLTTEEMRRALAAALPDYMIPALLVSLDALPLTPNRKLYRRWRRHGRPGAARCAGNPSRRGVARRA